MKIDKNPHEISIITWIRTFIDLLKEVEVFATPINSQNFIRTFWKMVFIDFRGKAIIFG